MADQLARGRQRGAMGVGLMVAFGAAMMLGACDGPVNVDRCFIRLAVVSPDPATVHVGEVITLHAQLSASSLCLPTDAQPANLRWSSADPSIATVDAVSGQVQGIKAGATQISLTTAKTLTLLTTSEVQVISP
ncbi:MAG: Ig domain-containing protein [Candidatus Dormibacteria bacterium]